MHDYLIAVAVEIMLCSHVLTVNAVSKTDLLDASKIALLYSFKGCCGCPTSCFCDNLTNDELSNILNNFCFADEDKVFWNLGCVKFTYRNEHFCRY